jgi:hypothetical protein
VGDGCGQHRGFLSEDRTHDTILSLLADAAADGEGGSPTQLHADVDSACSALAITTAAIIGRCAVPRQRQQHFLIPRAPSGRTISQASRREPGPSDIVRSQIIAAGAAEHVGVQTNGARRETRLSLESSRVLVTWHVAGPV